MVSVEGIGRRTQSGIYRAGIFGRLPKVPVSPARLESAAAKRMTRIAASYVIGAAGLETTARANRRAFDNWRITPRMLRDVDTRDLSLDLLGTPMTSPFLLSPIGVLDLAGAGGDLAVAAGAKQMGVPMVLSNQASVPMETLSKALDGSPHWFQLYWSNNDELAASMVSRAEASGAKAIVVTLDTHMIGWRPRDLDVASLPFAQGRGLAQYTSDPVFTALVRERAAKGRSGKRPSPTPAAIRTLTALSREYPGSFWDNLRSPLPQAAVETFLEVFSHSALTWDKLAFLREHTTLPIVLKGILHPDDARRALEHGIDAVMVSNHGGRQIDGAIASLDALTEVAAAVDGRAPVLFDSGIRGGADAFKALALGATAVGIGRPYVYGLALAGAQGVAEVLRNLIAEFDLTMGLAGCATLAEINRDTLRPV